MIGLQQASVQSEFFNQIRAEIPANLSFVDEVAEILGISNDSAYRRIRGEKAISFDEIAKLSRHFKISVDALLNVKSDSYVFRGKLANTQDHILDKWLENVLGQFEFMRTNENCKLYYLAKDLPLPHFFHIPELAAFKFFFWQKSILQYDELRGSRFEIGQIDQSCRKLSEQIVTAYNQVPTVEVWNAESINSTIRQIEFYRDSGMFGSKSEVLVMWDILMDLVNHLEKQAENGVKLAYSGGSEVSTATYEMFNNELILGNNTALADFGAFRLTFLNHSVINYISTQDPTFNDYMLSGIKNMIRKSEQLNSVNEKGRLNFFNKIRSKITRAKNTR